MPETAELAHQKLEAFWRDKSSKQGIGYVGHKDQSHLTQQKRIEDILRTRILPTAYYKDMLDYGCGYGRFIPFWNNFAGHIWAVDLLDEMLKQAAGQAPNVSAVRSVFPIRLPVRPHTIELLWSCLVFQHIVDDSLFFATALELTNLLKPGARVLLIDNAVDKAPHVKPRGPAVLCQALGLRPDYKAEKITINSRPNDHWLIDGFKT